MPARKYKTQSDSAKAKSDYGRTYSKGYAKRRMQYEPNYLRDKQLKESFGITGEYYEQMLTAQAGLCAICHGLGKHRLGVDHDHLTGKIRGLLCFSCNAALGLFQDSRERLETAILYLAKAK